MEEGKPQHNYKLFFFFARCLPKQPGRSARGNRRGEERQGEARMPAATCNACNVAFVDDDRKRLHYRSDWHRYNLKRKVAGVPGVTEALFSARQAVVAAEWSSDTPMLHRCLLCGKEYRSSKALAQHLHSRSHLARAAQAPDSSIAGVAIVRPLPGRRGGLSAVEDEELDDESASSNIMQEDEDPSRSDGDNRGDLEELDPAFCFMCDLKHETVEHCMVHLHRKHGFFVPDSEYLKDPHGFLAYAGQKVKRKFICLYCDDRCRPFQSLEAVRKHMDAKGHCKLRYGDGGDDEDADLEDFYDYSSSYVDVEGKQLIAAADVTSNIEVGSGGFELQITNKSDRGTRFRTLGSREFIRYYRQKPRPSVGTDHAVTISLTSSYKSMVC